MITKPSVFAVLLASAFFIPLSVSADDTTVADASYDSECRAMLGYLPDQELDASRITILRGCINQKRRTAAGILLREEQSERVEKRREGWNTVRGARVRTPQTSVQELRQINLKLRMFDRSTVKASVSRRQNRALRDEIRKREREARQPSTLKTVSVLSYVFDARTDRVLGSADARIAVIVYVDLECPFCVRNHETLMSLLEKYPKEVKLVFRHYPLAFHSHAMPSAEATECAAAQKGTDGLWSMVNLIMEKGAAPDETLIEYAAELGLDVSAFRECMTSDVTVKNIEAQMKAGIEAGVSGTPVHLVWDTKKGSFTLLSGALPLELFEEEIIKLLK